MKRKSHPKIKDRIFQKAHQHISDHLGTPITFLSLPGQPEATCLFKAEREQVKIADEMGWWLNITATIIPNIKTPVKRRDRVAIEGINYYVQEIYREGGGKLTLVLTEY